MNISGLLAALGPQGAAGMVPNAGQGMGGLLKGAAQQIPPIQP